MEIINTGQRLVLHYDFGIVIFVVAYFLLLSDVICDYYLVSIGISIIRIRGLSGCCIGGCTTEKNISNFSFYINLKYLSSYLY